MTAVHNDPTILPMEVFHSNNNNNNNDNNNNNNNDNNNNMSLMPFVKNT